MSSGVGAGAGAGSACLLVLFGLEELGGFGFKTLADRRDDLDEPEDHEGEEQKRTTAVRKAP